MANKKLRVTLMEEPVRHRQEAHGYGARSGLRRRHHTVEVEDTPAVRGMINQVSYMLKCEEV